MEEGSETDQVQGLDSFPYLERDTLFQILALEKNGHVCGMTFILTPMLFLKSNNNLV